MTLRPPSPEALLMMGDVVRRTGKSASTIRYYEESGLITAPERISGRRGYPTEIVRELAVIETARRAGMSLEEIRLLLRASPDDPARPTRRPSYSSRSRPRRALVAPVRPRGDP